jgi:hypothetical protein
MMKTPLIAGNSYFIGQSAAKHSEMNKGSTTRSKDRTSKWMEMGSNQKWLKIWSDLIGNYKRFVKNGTKTNEFV